MLMSLVQIETLLLRQHLLTAQYTVQVHFSVFLPDGHLQNWRGELGCLSDRIRFNGLNPTISVLLREKQNSVVFYKCRERDLPIIFNKKTRTCLVLQT